MKKALVCGAGGFIGSHLVGRLKKEGYWVRGVDLKYPEFSKTEADHFIKGDLRDLTVCRTALTLDSLTEQFDEVYQLAADMGGAGFVFTKENDVDIMHNSTQIHLNILKLHKKYKKIFYSSSACFVKGTEVFTDKGYVPIEEIDSTYKVIGEDGNWHKVIKGTKSAYKGKMCKVKGLGADDIICTPNHRFLDSDKSWVEAKLISKKNMFTVVPNLNSDNDIINLEKNKYELMYDELQTINYPLYKLAEKYGTSLNVPYNWKRNNILPRNVDSVRKTRIIKDYDLGLLIGLILSEGWYETHKDADTERLVVCFGKHEKDLIELYKEKLKLVFGIPEERIIQYNTRMAIKIHVTSKKLICVMDKLCSFKNRCYNKSLTQYGMVGSEKYRRGIIDGCNLGDGSTQIMENGFHRLLFSSTSKKLIKQLSLILKSLSLNNSINVRSKGKWCIEGRCGESRESYQLYTKENEIRIKDVEFFDVDETYVYNLEVEDVHSYIVDSLVVHNCIYPEYNQLDPNNPLCTEDSAYPSNPDSCYGKEKLYAEELYLAFSRNKNVNVRIARFHNIFGVRGSWTGGREKAPAAMCRKVAECSDGGTIEVWGSGEQTRSFLYIDECLDGVRTLMKSNFEGPVNIGSEEMISINNLAKMVIEISGKNINIKNIDGPIGVNGRNSDNTLCKEKLNWEPKMSLKDGMKKTYNWIKEQVKNELSKL